MSAPPAPPLTAGDLLTLDELRNLRRLSGLRGAGPVLHVFVPCWNLRRAHALLLAKGYGARMETAPSYRDVIRRLISGP